MLALSHSAYRIITFPRGNFLAPQPAEQFRKAARYNVTVPITGTVMKKSLGSRCRAQLLAIVLGLGAVLSLHAESLPFAGRWQADDNLEPQAGYTTLVIRGDTMSWHGKDKSVPKCVRQFALKKDKPGTVYTNARGTKFVAGAPGSIPTFLLQLNSGECGRSGDEVRINYPLIYDTRHIELIEYASGKPVSARRFHRKK
jgi:hypothetical protein